MVHVVVSLFWGFDILQLCGYVFGHANVQRSVSIIPIQVYTNVFSSFRIYLYCVILV